MIPSIFAVVDESESSLQGLGRAVGDATLSLIPLILATGILIVFAWLGFRRFRSREVFPAAVVELLDRIAAGVDCRNELRTECRQHPPATPLVRVVEAVFGTGSRDYVTVRAATDHAIEMEMAKLSRPTTAVETVYSGSTLLGLIGSAGGLIIAFRRVAATADPVKAGAALNATIAAALVATVLSLVLAIASLVVLKVLQDRIESVGLRLAETVEPLILMTCRPVVGPPPATAPAQLTASAIPIPGVRSS